MSTEYQKQYHKNYYRKNKKILLAYSYLWRQKNKEKRIAYEKQYREQNRQKLRDKEKLRYQKRKLKEAKRYVSKRMWEVRNIEHRRNFCREYYRKNSVEILRKRHLKKHSENPSSSVG